VSSRDSGSRAPGLGKAASAHTPPAPHPGPLPARGEREKGSARLLTKERAFGLLLVAPALAVLGLFFVYPLAFSIIGAFRGRDGSVTLDNFVRAFELYSTDVVFTAVIIALSVALIALIAVAIGGYLTLGRSAAARAILAALYRWPLFIPFIIAAQCMRTFLAKNGFMNNTFVAMGLLDPNLTVGFLDWRGIVVTFVWKQMPFVTLMVAGAMAALDRSMIESARNLGASRLRILVEIILPQVRTPLAVALILSAVTMMSVLSVPVMLSGQTPTMITVQMAHRIQAMGDYGLANALGVIAYLMAACFAWFYLRETVKERAA
jgi:putative spermidine/putrescine transport system permease protein